MFSSVDFPAGRAEEHHQLAFEEVQIHAAQRLHLDVAQR